MKSKLKLSVETGDPKMDEKYKEIAGKLTQKEKRDLNKIIDAKVKAKAEEESENIVNEKVNKIKKELEDEKETQIKAMKNTILRKVIEEGKKPKIEKFHTHANFDDDKEIGVQLAEIAERFKITFKPPASFLKRDRGVVRSEARDALYGEFADFLYELEEHGISKALIDKHILKFFNNRNEIKGAVKLYVPKRDSDLLLVFYLYLGLSGDSMSTWFSDMLKEKYKLYKDTDNMKLALSMFEDMKRIKIEAINMRAVKIRAQASEVIERKKDINDI